MAKKISDDLLKRYADNNCTDSEKAFVESWYNSFDQRPPLFPDEKNEEARKCMTDSKSAIMSTVSALEKKESMAVNAMGIVQTWFLKL